MNIQKILDYQTKDFEAIKLQKQLDTNEDKRAYEQMVDVVKNLQNRSINLEKEAGNLIEDYEQLKKTYEDNAKSAAVVTSKNLENIEDIDAISEVTNNIVANMSILEKKLLAMAERVNAILSEFEVSKKKYNEAREKHRNHKSKFEAESDKITPLIVKIEAELKLLEPDISVEVLKKYNQRRQDKIFPVFVPLVDKSCGGCRMQIPSASLETLKTKGFLECEHCRRIIYSE